MEGRKGKGGESENSSSEHSIPHPRVEGGGVGIPTPSVLIPYPGVEGVGGRSGNSNSEHSIPLPGV